MFLRGCKKPMVFSHANFYGGAESGIFIITPSAVKPQFNHNHQTPYTTPTVLGRHLFWFLKVLAVGSYGYVGPCAWCYHHQCMCVCVVQYIQYAYMLVHTRYSMVTRAMNMVKFSIGVCALALWFAGVTWWFLTQWVIA